MSSKSTEAMNRANRGNRLRLNSVQQPPVVRAREPVRRTSGRVVGYFPSKKNNRQIAWESQLEKRACLLFEFSPVVLTYKEQPTKVQYPISGTIRKYTPDFELMLSSKQRVYVEIKPAKVLKDERLITSLRAINSFFVANGDYFIVITDEELIQPVRQHNLSLLRPYLSYTLDESDFPESREYSESTLPKSFKDLATSNGSLHKTYALLAQGYIGFDIDEPLSLSSKLFLPKENKNETCLFTYRTAPDFERRSVCG